ncbi:MAG: DUF2062 domain-containing protein [Methylococcaceae bacterium]|nr:DUF2062 domain-containing protein [Methylococcaceae bacterium]
MPKKLIKKYLPDPETLKKNKNLQFLGDRLHEPNLWHLNRRSVATAFAIGLFCAWIPTPGQMAIAAAGAFYFRGNLPISVALVWITNPLTMPPMFYFAYFIGLIFLAQPAPSADFEFSLESMMSGLGDIWQPFLLGCLILGIVSAVLGYFGIKGFWRYSVSKQWLSRKKKNAEK